MENNQVVFAIDFSWLYSRSKYAFSGLSWDVNGVTYATGTVYGVYEVLMGVIEQYGGGVRIVLAMDGTPKKHRSVTGSYKVGRESDESLDLVQFSRWDVAKHFLVLPQVSIMYHDWLEGDEVLAHIALTKKENETVVLFSGDGDLRQLINSGSGVYCCNEHRQGYGYVMEDENSLYNDGVKGLSGLEPSAVALHLAICGDSSDGIFGIPRFLRSISKEIANQCKNIEGLKDLVDSCDTLIDGKFKTGVQKIRDNWNLVSDNYKLTFIDPLYIPKVYRLGDFNEDLDLKWFDTYGCQKVYSGLLAFLGQGTQVLGSDSLGVSGLSGLDNKIENAFTFEG